MYIKKIMRPCALPWQVLALPTAFCGVARFSEIDILVNYQWCTQSGFMNAVWVIWVTPLPGYLWTSWLLESQLTHWSIHMIFTMYSTVFVTELNKNKQQHLFNSRRSRTARPHSFVFPWAVESSRLQFLALA